jgi:hypothetical protein
MKRLAQRSTLGLVVLAAALVALLGASGARSTAILPTLYVDYTMSCTFSIVDDSGTPVTSVPPGNYQIDVRTPVPFGTIPKDYSDMTACKGMVQFQLTGPNVNIATTLTAGCESDEAYPATLEPNATYTAVDMNQPTVAHASFTTTATGSAQKITSPYTTTTLGKGTSSTDIVGSAVQPQGTLVGVLNPAGTLTLTQKGKPVTRLTAGRYTFSITDRSTKTGFAILGPKAHAPEKLTTPAFVGRKSATLMLTTGRWTFMSGLAQVHFFTVTAAT